MAVPGGDLSESPTDRPSHGVEPQVAAAELAPLQATLGLTTAAVAVVDSEGRIGGWTSGAERLLGHRADEIVGTPYTDLLVSRAGIPDGLTGKAECATPEGCDGQDGRALAACHHRHWSGLQDLRHRDGRVVRTHLEVVPLCREDGTHWFVWASEFTDSANLPPVRAAVMRTLLDHAPVALTIWDTDMRCVWLNTAAGNETGALSLLDIGRPVHEALRGFDTGMVASVMRKVLADGKPVIDHEFRWTSEEGTRERVFSASMFRLDTADGTPIGVCALGVDISSSWARSRLSMLSRAGRQVGTTLDVVTTAQELADVTVPLLADFAAVDLLESVPLDGGPPERTEVQEEGGLVPLYRRAATASVRKGVPESLFKVGEVVFARPASPFLRAATEGASIFEPDFRTKVDTWRHTEAERVAVMERTGFHSLMVVPLKARGATLGVAILGRTKNMAPFSRDDLLLAEELGLQAGLSIDNARRYMRERSAALALQRNLMPRKLSGGTTMDVASRYLPTDVHEGVGGDWFDVIQLPGARAALVIGDVVGHGINAAAAMGRFRTAVHTLADLDLPPDELLAHLDDLAVHLSESEMSPEACAMSPRKTEAVEAFSPPTMSATCVYAVYDAVTQTCTIARAGHPPPAVVDPSGFVTFPDLPAGAPVGLGVGSYESVELKLPEGSLIALYTDGLVERRSSDLDAGLDRLADTLSEAGPGAPLSPLCRRIVDSLTAGTGVEDDIALLLARTRAVDPANVSTWDVCQVPTAVADVRRAASAQLAGWQLDWLRPTVELIVSELVTNAIRYGRAPVKLRLIRDSGLVIEVADADSSSPRLRHARVTEETGRGLFLVSKTASRWGSRFTPDGKVTWAELDTSAA